MFGLIISGRRVDAAPQAITETQFAFRVSSSPSFSHIVVFILPGTQLPPGTAASVYVQIPPHQDFRLLGGIGPGKESAIFKIDGLKTSTVPGGGLDGHDMMTDGASIDGGNVPSDDIVIGISIEPVAQVETQLAALKGGSGSQQASSALVKVLSASGGRVTTKLLAQRIIRNAYNFLASYGSEVVPLKAFQDWWAKFEKKIELDPSFLERED